MVPMASTHSECAYSGADFAFTFDLFILVQATTWRTVLATAIQGMNYIRCFGFINFNMILCCCC